MTRRSCSSKGFFVSEVYDLVLELIMTGFISTIF